MLIFFTCTKSFHFIYVFYLLCALSSYLRFHTLILITSFHCISTFFLFFAFIFHIRVYSNRAQFHVISTFFNLLCALFISAVLHVISLHFLIFHIGVYFYVDLLCFTSFHVFLIFFPLFLFPHAYSNDFCVYLYTFV